MTDLKALAMAAARLLDDDQYGAVGHPVLIAYREAAHPAAVLGLIAERDEWRARAAALAVSGDDTVIKEVRERSAELLRGPERIATLEAALREIEQAPFIGSMEQVRQIARRALNQEGKR